MKNSIFDDDFHAGWENYVFNEEEIKWEGKTATKCNFRFLEKDPHHDVMTGISSIVFIYLIFLISLFQELSRHSLPLAVFILMLGLISPFMYEIIRCKSLKKTKYAVTNKYVLFKFFNGIKYRIKAIPFEDIVKTNLVRHQDGKGTIYLITRKKFNITTYNGSTGKKQDWPTIELVDDFIKINRLISEKIKSGIKNYPVYQPPMISKGVLKVTRFIYVSLLFIFSICLIDFYLLPVKAHVDTIVLAKSGYENDQIQNGIYLTESGLKFSSRNYSPSLKNKSANISRTRLFRMVKKVALIKSNKRIALISGLNEIMFVVVYFVVLAALLIGYWLIYNKERITQELYGKIIVSICVYMFFLWYISHLNN